MKRVLSGLLCLVLLITLCLTGPVLLRAEGAGLLSDFENEVYNGFLWNTDHGMLGNASTPASVQQEANGNHYLYMPAGEKNYARYYKDAPVQAGKTYRLSLRYKGTGFAMQIQGASEGGELLRADAVTEWTDYSRVFTMNNPLGVSISYSLTFWNMTGGNGVCIDDVYLTEVVKAESIAFAQGDQLTMSTGTAKQLTVVVKPDGAVLDGTVVYKSDNTAAVTVSANGLLTAVGLGTANITATVGEFSVTCTVTVATLLSDFENEVYNGFLWNTDHGMLGNASTPASVQQEANGNHYLYMPAGEKNYARYYKDAPVQAGKTYRLSLRYKGTGFALQIQGTSEGGELLRADAVTEWTDYSRVFTVNDPLTTSISYLFTFWNMTGGNGVCIDDVCLAEVVNTKGISFAEGEQLTVSKGATQQLTVVPHGGLKLDTVTYTSDNKAVVTVSADGLLTAVGTGTANITATVEDYSATCVVTVIPFASVLLGNFEGELSAGWTWSNATYGILNSSSPMSVVEDGTTGNHCLKIPPQSNNAAYGRNYYGAPLEAGKSYCITLKHKGSGAQLWLMQNGIDAGNGLHNLPACNDWQTFSTIFTAKTPANANFSIAFRHTGAAGTAYIDDVYLTEIIAAESIVFAEGTKLTLAKGETHQLTVVPKPDGATLQNKVAYKSDNTNAVTVSADGLLTAVAPGVANIVATSDKFSTLCTVTVDPYKPILLGNFEGELSAGWAWSNATYGIINSSSPMSVVEDGTTGNHCLKIPPQSDNAAYGRNYYGAPLEAGKSYRITFKYKGSGAQLWLMQNGVDVGSGLHDLPASDGWKTFSKTFTAKTPANANFSIAFRHTGAAGTAYVDDVYIKEATPFDEQIVDGDFETEVISSQWVNFLSNDKVSVVKDAIGGDSCLQFSGKVLPYMANLTEIKQGSYKVSFKLRGTGQAVLHFPAAVQGSQKVIGVSEEKYSVNGEYVYITTESDDEWTDCSVTFRMSEATVVDSVIGFGSNNDGETVYFDDVSLVALGTVYVQNGLAGGELKIQTSTAEGAILSGLHDGQTATAVKVTVMPKKGYLMVPGSLRYITSAGITRRILNKDGEQPGVGDGNTFTFDAPNENARIVADFVSTLDDDFSFGTVGTAVHTNPNGTSDGIRFLNRIQLTGFDETADGYTLTYQGEQYTINAFGMLLKNAEVHYSLDLETYDQVTHDAGGTVNMWKAESYNQETKVMYLVDFTDTYLDSCIEFVVDSPDADFSKQLYTARSYIVLEKEGVKTVLYSNERTDSVDTVSARKAGTLSDEVIVDTDSVGAADPSTPIPTDNLANADLKILNIGNSWGHNATSYLADVAAASGKTVKAVNLFKSGCSLKTHWQGYEENLPQYWYELNGYVYWDSAVTLKAVLASDDWDIIVTHASPSEGAGSYQEYLENLKTAIKKHCPDAKFYLMQTWAFGDDYEYLNNDTGLSRTEMWGKVEASSKAASEAIGIPLIPCGTAAYELETWFEENKPELSFYQADDSHAADTWGWYMLALVWYQTLTGEVPSDDFTEFDSAYTDDPIVREKVHEIAAAAVALYTN